MPAQVYVRFAFSNECGLAIDIVQRVGHEDAVEAGERPRLLHEISLVRADPHTLVCGRDSFEGRTVEVNRVNEASWRQPVGEGDSERAIATSEIGPDRWSERIDVGVGEHVNRVAQPHEGIITSG